VSPNSERKYKEALEAEGLLLGDDLAKCQQHLLLAATRGAKRPTSLALGTRKDLAPLNGVGSISG